MEFGKVLFFFVFSDCMRAEEVLIAFSLLCVEDQVTSLVFVVYQRFSGRFLRRRKNSFIACMNVSIATLILTFFASPPIRG